MKKNKGKIIILIVLILIIFLAIKPARFFYERAVRELQLEKIGSKNAIAYIEDKYGFIPEIISVEAKTRNTDPIPSLTKEYNGYVEVELKYNNKDFKVYITGNENSRTGVDNYQQDEIISSILNIISQYKGNYYSYSFTYGNYKYNSYNVEENIIYTNTYYNGSNIKDFLGPITLTINYINNSNFENSNNDLISLFEKGTLYLYNFKSEELLTEYQNKTFDYMVNDDRFANYVDKIIYIKDGDIQTFQYDD